MTQTAYADESRKVSDDALIVSALVFSQEKMYDQARQVYEELYARTGEVEFLFKASALALLTGNDVEEILKRLETYVAAHPRNIRAVRILLPIYLTRHESKKALALANKLTRLSLEPQDAALAAQAYLAAQKRNEAIAVLKKAYEKRHDEETLLRLVSLLELDANGRDEAIGLLEMHRRMDPETSEAVYQKLLSLYVKRNDIDGVISLYSDWYEKTPTAAMLQRLIQAYALKGDYEGAVAFLERHPKADPELLYKLYKSTKRFEKAAQLARERYARTKDPKWLAEEAIMLYEGAKKKDASLLRRVSEKFERAIKEGANDSLYLNYYGYTLIDHDLDVAKGIALLQDALKQQPSNSYYLDSLAWGLYKLGQCDKAYEVMRQVVRQEGLSHPDITKHWQAIETCEKHNASASRTQR